MRRKISVFLVFFCSTFFLANGQDVTPVNNIEGTLLNGNKDRIAFSQAEFHSEIKNKDNIVTLPFLNTKKDFNLEQFSIYGDEKNPYPEIKTYKISDVGNEGITGRITDGPAGTFLIYLQRGTMIRIYPEVSDKSVYYQEIGIDKSKTDNLVICDQHGEIDHDSNQQLLSEIKESIPVKRNGTTKRIYRAAIICTGEYYNANGGSTTTVRQRAIANLNDISAIFSQDLAVEFVMAPGSPRVESDPNNDPFIPDQMGGQGRTIQAQNAISGVFPNFRYDVGHVFHTHQTGDGWSSGGLAGLGVVCNDDRKASAWSGSFSNNNNGFIQLAAHEFGHQFNATHTFNGSDGLACDEGNHPDNTAYEIGSGTTIMSYNGLCAADQNIPSSGVLDNYFHVNSLDLMVNYMEQFGVCNDTEWINDNNNEPVVMANPCGAEYNLPRQTPFFLTGSATDADGDNLTYCWEGYDEDGINMTDTHGKIGQDAANTSDAPLWRSFPPTSDPTRYFPRIENVKDNNRSDFEVLPNRSRAMKMRLTVRDNNPSGGAVDWEQISINVESTMGPLQLTAPNGGETFDAGGIMTVTWNPRNSESMCTNAAIRLSTDGGATFPVTLASEVDYSTGTADVVLPASLTNTEEARIMVACDDYICFQWYDMSNANFSLQSNCFSPVTRLCDTEPGEYEFGEDALNFGLETITGVPALSVEGQVENTPPIMPPAVNDFNGNCTRIASISNAFDTLRFMVTESGSYRFDFETNGANFIKAYTIFDAATFDSGNACPSFIESNASFIGNFGFLPVITTELEACKEYLMASQITNGDTRDIAITGITGPGDFIPIAYAEDYSTTFIAIDPATDEIKFFDNNSDFRMLEAGEYNIYASSYKSGGPTPPADVDLNSWIGMTPEDLLSSGDCYRIGVNFKPVIIISTCTVFDMTPTDQTMCDPITNTYSQTLTFKIDKGPGTGTVEINGQVFNVQPDSMEVTLTGLISDGNPVDLAIAFSDDISCNRILDDVFTAPENCCPVSVDLGDQVLVECEGNNIILDGGPDGTVYQWFRDGIELMDSERELTVTESGTYQIIVSDANGCAKPDEVEVQFNPLADILPAQDVEGCEGDVFTVAPVTTADSLAWYNNGVYLASGPELDITESGEYIIYAINEFGCERADTFQANFLEAPVVDFGDDQVLCEGDVLILDAGDPDNFYGWVKDGVQLSESSNMLEVTEDGTYIVVVVNTNLCESIDQITVSFRELPDLDLGENQMLCQGETYEIIANANGFDIEWYKDDVLIQGESGDTLTVSETGNYRTKVSAGDDCSIEDEIQVTFNESPVVDLGEDQLLCEGTIFQLDAGDNTNTHVWTQDGVDLMNDTNIQEATTNGNFIVVATNANDCSTTDTISLEFNPLPDIDLGPDQSLCADMIYTIQANTNGFDIEWYTNGVLQSGATGFELIASESGEYIARVYSGVDCFREDTVQVTYNPLPDFDLGEDRSACEGETITIDAGTGGYDYEWYINGTLIQQGAMSTLDIFEDAEIIVTAYTEFECTSSDTINATFIQMPEVSLEDDFEFCEGESITITASSNISALTWFRDGNELAGETDLTLVTDQGGEYIAVAGTGGLCEDRDTIMANAVAVPDFVINGPNIICEDENAQLFVSLDPGETIKWFKDGIELPNTTTSIRPEEDGTYSAIVSNPTGCQSEQSHPFSIEATPNIMVPIIPDLCQGDTYTVEVETDGVTFQWEDDNGIIQGETGTTLDVTTGGTYAFTAFSTIGCESTIFFLVTVEAIPTVDLGADKTACEGEMVEIQLPDNSDLEYEWSRDGSVLPGESSNSLVVVTGGTYSATVTSRAGCSASDEVEVTFNTPPTYDLTDSASFCEGLTTDLELTTNAVNITWLLNGNIQAQNINTLTVDQAGEYTVELSSAEGCTITAMTNVEVFSNPVIDIDDVDLCPGESQDIMVMTGYNSYTWDGINATGAEATINYQEFPQITTEQLSLTVVDQNSCSAMALFEVTYFPPINASVASSNVGICSGESATLQAFGGLFYEWNDPNGTLSADNISNPVASPSQTTAYEVTISDNCPNNIETLNIVVSVNDPPDAFAGLDTCIIIGTDFKLNASGGSTYSWDNSEFIIGSSNIPDPVIRIDSTTLFTVTVTDSNGCTDTDNIEICIIDDPLSLLDEVTILTPNGDGKNDELVFRGLEAFPENKLTIFNRWGGVIYEKVGYQRDGQRWSGLRDGVELPADTYYYILEFADLKLKTSLTIIRE